MANALENLALRLANDPFFLACSLTVFAQSAGLNGSQLAESLGCSLETLVLVRLCRAPGSQPGQFQKDIARIATRYQVNAEGLSDAVRRGQVLWNMRQNQSGGRGTLLAARDGEPSAEDQP